MVLFEGVYGVVGGTDGKIEPLVVGCLGWVVVRFGGFYLELNKCMYWYLLREEFANQSLTRRVFMVLKRR